MPAPWATYPEPAQVLLRYVRLLASRRSPGILWLWLADIPAPLEIVVYRHVYQPGIHAIQEALDQPQQKTPPGKPLERRQQLFEERMHVQRLRRDQTVDHAYDKRDRAP